MLRCVITKRILRNPQKPWQELSSIRQCSAGKLYQTRSLGFLPIVSSLDTTKKESPQKKGLDKPRIIHKPDNTCDISLECSEPYDNAGTETPHDVDNADLHEKPPAHSNHFSATLADGTIVHSGWEKVTQSQFADLVSMVVKIWKQCSHEIIPKLPAQRVGILVYQRLGEDSRFTLRIYDNGVGGGRRRMFTQYWLASKEDLVLLSSQMQDGKSFTWTRVMLVKALENHVGTVDQYGALAMLASPAPHTLYHEFADFERLFSYKDLAAKYPMSVVLDDRTFVSPISEAVIEPSIFLSLATMSLQWWQQEQGLQSEALSGMTNVRIMYVYWSLGYSLLIALQRIRSHRKIPQIRGLDAESIRR